MKNICECVCRQSSIIYKHEVIKIILLILTWQHCVDASIKYYSVVYLNEPPDLCCFDYIKSRKSTDRNAVESTAKNG